MKRQKRTQVALSLAALIALIAGSTSARTIIYVDGRAPGASDGSSWENAYLCLQNALSAANPGSTIRVAQGTYKPDRRAVRSGTDGPRRRAVAIQSDDELTVVASGWRHESFSLRNDVTIRGGYAGYGASDPNARDGAAYQSILSGDLSGNDAELPDLDGGNLGDYVDHPSLADNSYTVVKAHRLYGGAVLDGFTITGGTANWSPDELLPDPNIYSSPNPHDAKDGAGAYIQWAAPTFVRCTFYRNVTRAAEGISAGGGAVVCEECSPTFQECSFRENIVYGSGPRSYGGALLSFGGEYNFTHSNPVLTDCTFVDNIAAGFDGQHAGGALACFNGTPKLTGCSFVGNTALHAGGAVFNGDGAVPAFIDCILQGNTANFGGAVCNENESTPAFRNCVFLQNGAGEEGGAVSGTGSPQFYNCLFNGNSAPRGGAISCDSTQLMLGSSTLAANAAVDNGGAVFAANSSLTIFNCILWNDTPNEVHLIGGSANVAYSDMQGGWTGPGNIDADPEFLDAFGPDGTEGTPDDDLRLSVASPCVDLGDNAALPLELTTDLDGYPRVTDGWTDMGAYEFHGPYNYYVDAVNGDDSNHGGNPQKALATIQGAIASAKEGYNILVGPGVYTEEIDFRGRAITVMGSAGAPILEAPGDYAVSFYSAEGRGSVLKNFVIRNSNVGIFIAGSSPTICNVTLANNEFGIAAYAGANPDISHCILWDNIEGDLFGCTTRFSCVQQGAEGQGNISTDPLFADPAGGDYHLLAERGRYVPAYGLWSFDTEISPCVDAGDPVVDVGAERMPNGGRINMGAFGGTAEASMSEWPLAADINHDGIVDLRDLAIISDQWLMRLPGAPGPASGDAAAPQPDPAQWDPYGLPREFNGGGGEPFDYWVEMKAVEATDPSGPVEYFFECRDHRGVFPDGLSSGWQTDPSYTILVGRANQAFQFRVRARDGYGNTTAWSPYELAIPRPGQVPNR